MARSDFDRATGEIMKEPEFVKVYINDLCNVKGLTGTQARIFNFLLSNMNHSNVASYGSCTKAEFLKEHGVKNQTFNNSITGLIDSGLIERVGRAEFRINKKYAVKVDWHKVQFIEWKTTYSADGKVETVKLGNI